jgi:hypothetical protein
MKKQNLLMIVLVFLITQTYINAQQTIWYSPLNLIGQSNEINIVPSLYTNLNAAEITSTSFGSDLAVLIGLNLNSNQKIDSVIIYYQLSNSASFISQIRLGNMTNPNTSSVFFDDPTDLTSTLPYRYSSFVAGPAVNGIITLMLFLNFANSVDQIYIGAIGVVVSPVTTSLGNESQIGINNNFKLEQNYPNPFNPSTKIDYNVPSTNNVKINIYNSNGELLRTLLNEEQNSGERSVTWNGKDSNGNIVSSGVYFYQIQIGELAAAKKMILLR